MERKTGNLTMKKQLNYADIIKEVLILTGAVAIIAAAVYFFLVPSHTSVSSISGLGIVLSNFVPLPLSAITMILNVVPVSYTHLEEAMDNIDYYMKCLNAPSLLASLKILLDSLWERGEDKDSDSGSGSIMQQVEQIHKYMERSYHENITLTALAEEYHMDASYLSRSFSQKYGETIIAFLTRIRMEKAAELMKDPDKKLETISFLVGYDDYNYFSRVFRKKMGCSPRDYRNNLAQL